MQGYFAGVPDSAEGMIHVAECRYTVAVPDSIQATVGHTQFVSNVSQRW